MIGKTNYWNMLYELIPELDKAQLNCPVKSKRYPFCKQIILTDFDYEPNEHKGTFKYKDTFVYGPFGYYENPLRRIALTINEHDPALIILEGDDIKKATVI